MRISDQLKQMFEEKHQAALEEFGTPEKILTLEEVSVWRFSGVVAEVYEWENITFPSIVPVFVDGKEIGAASLRIEGKTSRMLVAEVTASREHPYRLDSELGDGFALRIGDCSTFGRQVGDDWQEDTEVTSLTLVRSSPNMIVSEKTDE